MGRVLLVDFDKRSQKILKKIYGTAQVPVETEESIESALSKIQTDSPALVLMREPDHIEEVKAVVSTINVNSPATPLVVCMRHPDMEKALWAMQYGAYECVSFPLRRLDILAASKRATERSGRTLIAAKVKPTPRRTLRILISMFLLASTGAGLRVWVNGPPVNSMTLDSNYLSGLQWSERTLWVGDWFNSTVTEFALETNILRKQRKLTTKNLFRMKDGQPILIAKTPDFLVTIGTDLNLRSHKWEVGMPTIQTVKTPGSDPSGLAWDGTHIWTSDGRDGALYRYDKFFRVIETKKSIFKTPSTLAWNENAMWVIGGSPLSVAKLERRGNGFVWHGPYRISDWLPAGKVPTGLASGYGRLWVVMEGDSRLTSKSINEIIHQKLEWIEKAEDPKNVKDVKEVG